MSDDISFQRPIRPRRSVLYVPADNDRAMMKSLTLPCDAIIYDLEDAVLPDQKPAAREALRTFFHQHLSTDKIVSLNKDIFVRINALSTPWGSEDLLAARAMMPSGIVLPKVSETDDLIEVTDALEQMDCPPELRIWAMIETARGILNVATIAQYARTPGTRLDCFVAGTNDLVRETMVHPVEGRPYLSNWLSQIVLAARAYGLDVVDGVYNDFNDPDGFAIECQTGRAMGFDGKSLIHPSQIAISNDVYGIADVDLADARKIVEAFAHADNQQAGVIQIDGKMVERLHLEMAERLIEKADIIKVSEH